MSKRKPHNMRARMGRALGAILRSNAVAVVNLDPSGRQGMVNWRNCKSIPPGRRIADLSERLIDRIGQLCTTPHESKERFIRRVQSVIEWQTAAQQDQPK